MLDEPREVLATGLRISAVVVSDRLHYGVGLLIVLVENVFSHTDVDGWTQRIPRGSKPVRMALPIDLHKAHIEIGAAFRDEKADRAISVVPRAKEESAACNIERPWPCSTFVRGLVKRNPRENLRIDRRMHGLKRRLR